MQYSASGSLFSRQHCLAFHLLEDLALWVSHDAIQSEEVRISHSMSGIFQTEFMCECENVFDADVIDRYECTMSASASMFSISLRE
jgi:hypothetical protein